MEERLFYVYVDRTRDTNEVFYVGKGNAERVKFTARNRKHQNIVKKHGLVRDIAVCVADESVAFSAEIELIRRLHTFVDDPLVNEHACNFTTGGDGGSLSLETRRKLSEKMNSESVRRKLSERAKLGMTPKVRQKISENTKRAMAAPEIRQKFVGKRFTDDHRRAISESIAPERRRQINENIRKAMTEDVRRGMSERQRGRVFTEEHLRKLSEARRKRKMGPCSSETKHKISEANKRAWERKRIGHATKISRDDNDE